MTTTLCRIVLTVVSCTVDPSAPAPTPKEAVAIITASLGPSRVPAATPAIEPDPVVIVPFDRDWPFTGSFAPTWVPTDRWLDGTPRVDPLAYGYGTPWLFGTPFGSGLYGGPAHRGGRPGARVDRPLERTPVTPRMAVRVPSQGVRAPLAAPGGSVRMNVGKD
jgi:hypothetical protein